MDEFVQLRRHLHKHPQASHKEFQTTKLIKEIAIKHGVRQEQITAITETGLWVDLAGEAQPQGKDVHIALRADIDALEMEETNESLEYCSVDKGAAHMCGHDGHTACLAATIPLFLQKAKDIPSNKKVRLIFQPAEQAISNPGAQEFIKAGCLKGIEEIYGFHNHNIPLFPFGFFSCKEGVFMAAACVVKIKITGTGGHGSEPESLKYVLPKAIEFYSNIMKLQKELKQKHGDVFTIMFPLLKSGERFNVISQSVIIEGTIRTFSNELLAFILAEIRNGLDLLKHEGFEVDFLHSSIGVTSNHKKETQNVVRVAKRLHGENITGSSGFPVKGSEDFGFYLEQIPGTFFFVSGADEEHQGQPHIKNYNFNDKLIPYVSNFWMELLEDRFAQ